jgi:uncharacterized protein
MNKLYFFPLIVIQLLFSNSVSAASFDCSIENLNQIEKIICGDPILSNLDEGLSDLYSKFDSKLFRTSQLNWIKQRNKCTSSNYIESVLCIEDSYRKRFIVLRDSISITTQTIEHKTDAYVEIGDSKLVQVNYVTERVFNTANSNEWENKFIPFQVIARLISNNVLAFKGLRETLKYHYIYEINQWDFEEYILDDYKKSSYQEIKLDFINNELIRLENIHYIWSGTSWIDFSSYIAFNYKTFETDNILGRMMTNKLFQSALDPILNDLNPQHKENFKSDKKVCSLNRLNKIITCKFGRPGPYKIDIKKLDLKNILGSDYDKYLLSYPIFKRVNFD